MARESEKVVLSAILDPYANPSEIIGSLRANPNMFKEDSHRAYFKSILQEMEDGNALSAHSICDRIERDSKFEWDNLVVSTSAAGETPLSFLIGLTMNDYQVANVEHHVGRMVQDYSAIKFHEMLASAKKHTHPLEAARELEKNISLLLNDALPERVETIGERYEQDFKEIDALDGNVAGGYPTGIDGIDKIMGGVKDGQLIIVGARPSVGKTAFAMTIMDSMMLMNAPVAFFSYDMGKRDLLARMISFHSGLTVDEILTKKWKMSNGADKYRRARDTIRKLPLYLEHLHFNAETLAMKIRQYVRKAGVKVVFVDYLQIVPCPPFRKEYDIVTNIVKVLKSLVHELDITIVALSQLSRSSSTEDRLPNLTDLRSSGQIEQDASVVLMPHRFKVPEDELPSNLRGIDNNILAQEGVIVVAKQQNGPTGVVPVKLEKGFRWVQR